VFTGFAGVVGFSCLRFNLLKRSLMVLSMAAVPRSVVSMIGSRVLWSLGGEQMNSGSLLTLSRDEIEGQDVMIRLVDLRRPI
jgi:hypothetical protein